MDLKGYELVKAAVGERHHVHPEPVEGEDVSFVHVTPLQGTNEADSSHDATNVLNDLDRAELMERHNLHRPVEWDKPEFRFMAIGGGGVILVDLNAKTS